ncbi:MAG: bifunctional diaminohydroxyphosphoribosylaminopyrimidine deaminase/5-amino-6-(5-phosphoribosylamino)uracil reductase RibD [Candidatus Bipolaricaulota bacterium]|nr:bifunctional diaminohydroxyphosphoribosylaminopyrimidine deaminase/5-amino-6-(5-phosphoribosylamino)uracil reductase RibD [Candidatus Bipolaricaulota bacterium]MDW8031216.1 bifunctional diaminohydroxyphosphoribosylaminopyrimidine deaminase/5-amino-6-(5-phosphoribosylamino)uracil reductase RibD [Candidatus Bipolaricaulota bacterium]
MMSPQDFMRRALELAERGAGWTSPNPMVGAVIVKNNTIVSEGWHEEFGSPHAEFVALQRAGALAHNADLYLNLEPCIAAPGKRNPPCADEIIRAGIKRVFVALRDPDPRINGRGIDALRRAGIEVIEGLLEREARKLNEIYLKFKTAGRPFVTLKMAMTADGKIATRAGDSRWISSQRSLKFAHELRHRHRAILVGIETVLADDPQLTARLAKKTRNPIRIVVDSRGRLPLEAQVVRSAHQLRTILATTDAIASDKERALRRASVEIWKLPARDGRVDPHAVIERLAHEQIDSVLIEGGAEIAWSFLRERLVDKVLFVIAPKIVGGRAAPGPVGGTGIERLSEAISLREITISRLDEDVLYEAYLDKESTVPP